MLLYGDRLPQSSGPTTAAGGSAPHGGAAAARSAAAVAAASPSPTGSRPVASLVRCPLAAAPRQHQRRHHGRLTPAALATGNAGRRSPRVPARPWTRTARRWPSSSRGTLIYSWGTTRGATSCTGADWAELVELQQRYLRRPMDDHRPQIVHPLSRCFDTRLLTVS